MANGSLYEANELRAKVFAAYFDPPLKVVRTLAFGGQPIAGGAMAAGFDPKTRLGVTAVFWGNGAFKAFVEYAGNADAIGEIGELFAQVFRPVPDDPEIINAVAIKDHAA